MGSIGETVSGWWSKVTGKTPDQTAAPIAQQLPTGRDIGTASEPAGYTSAGGRRLSKMRKGKKTMRGGKRHRKTHRSRKH